MLRILRTIISKIYPAHLIDVCRLIMETAENELIDVVRNGIDSSKRGSMERRTFIASMSTAMDRRTMKDVLMINCENEYSEEKEGKKKFLLSTEGKPHTNRRERIAQVSFRDEEVGDDSGDESYEFDPLSQHWKRQKINGGFVRMYFQSRKDWIDIL